MNSLRLIKPTITLESEYRIMLQDWVDSGEKLVPFVLEYDSSDFAAMVNRCKNDSLGFPKPVEGRLVLVPSSTFWLVNVENDIVGVVNIRHYLNNILRKTGGHIGYGIAPSHRRKGYATKILQLALTEAKKLNIEKVMLSCFTDNIASTKTIIKNGGVFTEVRDFLEKKINVYWIKL